MLLFEGAFQIRFERCYWLDADGCSANKIFRLVLTLTKSSRLFHIIIIRIILFVFCIILSIVIVYCILKDIRLHPNPASQQECPEKYCTRPCPKQI